MNQPTPAQNQEAIQEQLVAYLDGELEPAECEQVEKRLSDDPSYRKQLTELQRTWDMLDYLPRAQVGDEFIHTTVEMVAVKAADDTAKRQGAIRVRRIATWLAVVAAGTLAAFFGYGTVYRRLDAPNRQLLEDLPVVENVDLYYHAEDIQFLEKLAASGAFDEEVDPVDYAP